MMGETTFLQRELKRRMKLKGLSMRALSIKAGLNDSAVKAIMSGKSKNPRSDTLGAIAVVLECTVNDLLGPANGGPAVNPRPLSSSHEERIVDAVRDALRSVGMPDALRKRGRR